MEGYNRLESFDFEVDNWDAYRERLEQLFHINGHAGSEEADLARRRAVLLTVCGKKTYELLRTLAAPAKPADKTYNELCTLLEGRCSTKPSLVMRRFKFHSRNRDSGESVTNFVTALRKLAAECEFTDLDDQLRDRIVCGINDAEMQRQMLRETTLNLKKAISIATTTEATERQVSQLVTAQKASRSELDTAKSSERAKNETGIHRTAHSTTLEGSRAPGRKTYDVNSCFRCGSKQHSPEGCPFKDATCHSCKKKGHIRRMCRLRQKQYKRSIYEIDHESCNQAAGTKEQLQGGDDNDLSIGGSTPLLSTACSRFPEGRQRPSWWMSSWMAKSSRWSWTLEQLSL